MSADETAGNTSSASLMKSFIKFTECYICVHRLSTNDNLDDVSDMQMHW